MPDLEILRAPVTYGLIVLNLIVSGFAFFVNDATLNRFALAIGPVLRGREYDRLIMHGFLHVDLPHFLFNMFTLFSFGRILEIYVLGSTGFLMLYFGSLLVAAFVTLGVKRNDLLYSSVGASGAISGVVLSFCLFQPFSELFIFFIPIGIPAFLFAAIYLAYSSYAAAGGVRDRIAHEAHLGGALGGIALTLMIEPRAWAIFISQISQAFG